MLCSALLAKAGLLLARLLARCIEYRARLALLSCLFGLLSRLFGGLFLGGLLALLLLRGALGIALLLRLTAAIHGRFEALPRFVARLRILGFVLTRFFLPFGIGTLLVAAAYFRHGEKRSPTPLSVGFFTGC